MGNEGTVYEGILVSLFMDRAEIDKLEKVTEAYLGSPCSPADVNEAINSVMRDFHSDATRIGVRITAPTDANPKIAKLPEMLVKQFNQQPGVQVTLGDTVRFLGVSQESGELTVDCILAKLVPTG
ncbi:MAG: hypothetical protein H6853_04750 [Rhodospirillales bacterium]|nr:hypothetical protein [Alphaproteobacteria bacterium]USO02862.1 MAG: hypothetical protein H6853_04750 [Rhodospirillales bacterium]